MRCIEARDCRRGAPQRYSRSPEERALTMNDASLLTRRVVVEGRVQGVGYRHFARSAALRLGVAGWARNRDDGSVEALLYGPADAVDALIAELRRGPPGARVLSLEVVETNETEVGPSPFEVRATR
jgi:acylphosphatase